MKKTKNRVLLAVLAAVCVLAFALAWLPLGKRTAYAADDTSIYSIANTYDATITQKTETIDGTTYTYDFATYDLTAKRQNATVSTGSPQVTFITHGLWANATCWSNGGIKKGASASDTVIYTENSIIELLKQKADCNVYIADFDKSEIATTQKTISFKYRLTMINDDYSTTEDFSGDSNVKNKIVDNTKHSIVLFQAYMPSGTNDFIYAQFNIMASKIINDLSELDKDHALPRVNLIGHSRGGLTNLQYALDHPDLVESVFSLGTPYVGSTSAELDSNLLGNAFQEDSNGKQDIINYEKYTGYMERWNNNYDRLYKKINVYALGGYESFDMLLYELLYDVLPENVFLDGTVKAALNAINRFLTLELAFNSDIGLASELSGKVIDMLERFFPILMNQNNLLGGIRASLSFALQETEFNWKTFSYDILNDMAVDLPSQLGKEGNTGRKYKGFNTYQKRFNIFANADLERSGDAPVRITHQLETMDIDLIKYIVKNIQCSGNENGSPYLYSVNDDQNSVSITGYIGKFDGDTLTIPSAIAVKDKGVLKVTEIGQYAFADCFNEETGIEHVVIPSTVKSIQAYAFADNENLETVSFSGNSELVTIGEYAFDGCDALKRFNTSTENCINIPDNVERIGAGAFSAGNFITSVNIPAKTVTIGALAFGHANHLNNISVAASNTYYKSYDGNLYNRDGWLVQYAIGKNQTEFTMPKSVSGTAIKQIGDFAFCNAKNLRTVNLTDVETIRDFAFAGCENFANLNESNQIKYVSRNAFVGSQISHGNGDFWVIGELLYEYNGTANVITKDMFPSAVRRIGEYAFATSETLEDIYLPLNILSVGDYAFSGCSQLNKVQFENMVLPTMYEQAFIGTGDDFAFYCAKSLQEEMQASGDWETVNIQPITTQAYFADINETVTFYYGEIASAPETKIEGKYILHWREVIGSENGQPVLSERVLGTNIWMRTDSEVRFSPDTITFNSYDFLFYNGPESTIDYYVGTVHVSIGDYIRFDKYNYIVNGVSNGFNEADKMNLYYFDGYLENQLIENYINDDEMEEEVYCKFEGWYFNDKAIGYECTEQWLTNYNRKSIALIAKWIPIEYNVTYRYNDGVTPDKVDAYDFFHGGQIESPSRSEYIFKGWKDQNGGDVTTLNGKFGDIVLTAEWEALYTITLNSTCPCGCICGSCSFTRVEKGVIGNTIKLPQLECCYYKLISWSGNNPDEAYVIKGNATLTSEWKKIYLIVFSNLKFQNYRASVKTGDKFAETKIFVGEKVLLDHYIPQFPSSMPNVENIRFIGWCTDEALQNQITEISSSQKNNIMIYAKWRYDVAPLVRKTTYTITDSGFRKQSYDCLKINTSGLFDGLKGLGITELSLKFKIRLWEVNDGYQHIFLYDGLSTSANLLWESKYSHGHGSKPDTLTVPGIYTFYISVPLEKLKNVDNLYIMYGASGLGADTWKTDLAFCEGMFVVSSADIDNPRYLWDDNDPMKNSSDPHIYL